MPNRLHCKFCNWTTPKAFTGKDGKFKGVDAAHRRLEDHVIMDHYHEWEAVQRQLAEAEHN